MSGSLEILAGSQDYLLRLTPAGDTELELWAAQRSVAPLEATLHRIVRFEVSNGTVAAASLPRVPRGRGTPRDTGRVTDDILETRPASANRGRTARPTH